MSEVRLIDANALKEIFLQDRCGDNFLPKHFVIATIDEAPTVEQEVYITGTDYDFYIRGYKEGRKDFERPKGEWIEVKDAFGWATYYHWDCPFCKTKCGKISNFCPECGADMRGKKNDTKKD